MKLILLCLIYPFCLFASIHWQGTDSSGAFLAQVTLSREEASLNDPLELTLTLTYPTHYETSPELLHHQLLSTLPGQPPRFFIRSENKIEQRNEDKKILQIQYQLFPLMVGETHLSFYTIPFRLQETKTPTVWVATQVFSLNILPAKQETSALFDPLDLLDLSLKVPLELNFLNQKLMDQHHQIAKVHNWLFKQSKHLPWLWLVIILLCALFYRLAFKEKTLLKPLPTLSAQELAFQDLKNLSLQSVDPKTYFVRLSQIVEDYPIKQVGQLENFEKLAEQVKFANYIPLPQESEQAYREVQSFVASSSSDNKLKS